MSPALPAGTIRVTLAGDTQDIIKLSIFLEAVATRHDPAEAMRNLHLVGIAITDMEKSRGRSAGQFTLLVRLLAAAPPPEEASLS